MYSTYTRLISHILLLSEHQHYSLIIIGYVGFWVVKLWPETTQSLPLLRTYYLLSDPPDQWHRYRLVNLVNDIYGRFLLQEVYHTGNQFRDQFSLS